MNFLCISTPNFPLSLPIVKAEDDGPFLCTTTTFPVLSPLPQPPLYPNYMQTQFDNICSIKQCMKDSWSGPVLILYVDSLVTQHAQTISDLIESMYTTKPTGCSGDIRDMLSERYRPPVCRVNVKHPRTLLPAKLGIIPGFGYSEEIWR